MRTIIIDTDGSLRQDAMRSIADDHVSLNDLRSRLQYFSDAKTLAECRRRLFTSSTVVGACRLLGSGDFHHLTLAILEELDLPFALIVFDNHFDCSYPFPKYACGNWLYHVAALPFCQKIIHVASTETYGMLRCCGRALCSLVLPYRNLPCFQDRT